MPRFEKPRGTRDFLPNEMAIRQYVEILTRQAIESFGFQPIQTPIFEQYELLSARSGEEIRESLFTFASDAGRYALRPELTSPVCRLLAGGELAGLPQPYKLYYFGPCFRYCRPQAARYREFYQVGVELMGASNPLADAEIIALSAQILQRLGIDNYQLHLGDVGVFRSLLDEEDASERQMQDRQNRVLSDIDRFMHVREKCEGMATQEEITEDDRAWIEVVTRTLRRLQDETSAEDKTEILGSQSELTQEEWKKHAQNLPDLAEKTFRESWVFHNVLSEEKAGLILKVSRMRGDCATVMKDARQTLAGNPALESLDNLEKVCNWLTVLGVDNYEVALGTARNLDFYTGTVFEIYTPLMGGTKQLCGGGRYDNLVKDFEGPATPATGFAFGFDRVVEAFRATHPPMQVSAADVVVVSGADQREQAVQLAQQLRNENLRVIVPLDDVEESKQIGYAEKIQAPARVSLVSGSTEQFTLTAKDGTKKTVTADDLASEIKSTLQ